MTVLHKVTAFITREGSDGPELLLFRHPYAGVQIPAGSVEVGEAFEAAALREAHEESGLPLDSLRIVESLGTRDDPLPPDYVSLLEAAIAHSRPDSASFDWIRFRRGTMVRRLREQQGFTQVEYYEYDRWPDPQYITFLIKGWVASEMLAQRQTRHYFRVSFNGDTPAEWTVNTDQHTFAPFWAALHHLPPIIPPQDRWLEFLPELTRPG